MSRKDILKMVTVDCNHDRRIKTIQKNHLYIQASLLARDALAASRERDTISPHPAIAGKSTPWQQIISAIRGPNFGLEEKKERWLV